MVYENGQKVIEACVFCEEPYDEALALGAWITCPGCGQKYRLQVPAKTIGSTG